MFAFSKLFFVCKSNTFYNPAQIKTEHSCFGYISTRTQLYNTPSILVPNGDGHTIRLCQAWQRGGNFQNRSTREYLCSTWRVWSHFRHNSSASEPANQRKSCVHFIFLHVKNDWLQMSVTRGAGSRHLYRWQFIFFFCAFWGSEYFLRTCWKFISINF